MQFTFNLLIHEWAHHSAFESAAEHWCVFSSLRLFLLITVDWIISVGAVTTLRWLIKSVCVELTLVGVGRRWKILTHILLILRISGCYFSDGCCSVNKNILRVGPKRFRFRRCRNKICFSTVRRLTDIIFSPLSPAAAPLFSSVPPPPLPRCRDLSEGGSSLVVPEEDGSLQERQRAELPHQVTR